MASPSDGPRAHEHATRESARRDIARRNIEIRNLEIRARALPTVELRTPALVISDLHVPLDDAHEVDAFVAWLGALREARALFVLGDLFEYWIGPAHLAHPGARRVCDAFRAFADERGPVHVLHGNRDFLLDASFEHATRARVHAFGVVAASSQLARTSHAARASYSAPSSHGAGAAPQTLRRVLLLHGDELCIHDHAYQRLRRVLRSRPVAWLARTLPRFALEAAARRLRRSSRGAVAAKRPLDVEQVSDVAWSWLDACDADELVCGHAHRYRDERARDGRRWRVLDAFGGAHSVLEFGADGDSRALAPLELVAPNAP